MDEKDIRTYARLMEELNLTGLEIESEGSRMRLERSPAPVQTVAAPAAVPAPQAEQGTLPVSEEPGVVTVTSPMVGVFYAAPSEDAKPYVQVGDRVKAGDVLCIIEAMKLLNEIAAEQDGVVAEICVENAETVDYGAPLFKLRRA